MSDLRFALRMLRRAPGFAAVAVLTLGIAIGANTTVYSLVVAICFPRSEFPNPDRLVSVSETSATKLCAGCGVGTSGPTYRDWQAAASSFARWGAYVEQGVVVSAPLVPKHVSAARVTASLFSTLGVAPQAGRDFAEGDDTPGAPPVVILSGAMWHRDFQASPSVIGSVLRVDGVPHTVIGVMRDEIRFPEVAILWLPLVIDTTPARDDRSLGRDDRSLGIVARLREGVTVAQADAEIKVVARGLEQAHPEQREWGAFVQTLDADRADETGTAFWALLGAVGLVLAVACANLGALFLARASRRYRELAVRAALGASRGRLIRQLVVESSVIGLAGGLLGLLLANYGIRIAAAGIDTPIPYYVRFVIDGRVLAFCAVMSIAAGVLCGLVPALAASRPSLINGGLRLGGITGVGGQPRHSRLRHGLVVAELALVLVLLAGAALMGKTFLRFRQPPPYDLRGLTMADVSFGGERYQDPGALRVAAEQLAEAMAATPGWRGGFAHTEFLRGFGANARKASTSAGEIPPEGAPRFGFAVTPGYLEGQGLPLQAGRTIAATDRLGTEPIVVVNQRFAEAAWPGISPIGQKVLLPVQGAPPEWRTVVGVVGNAESADGSARRPHAYAYLAYAQLPRRPLELLIRTNDGTTAVGDRLQAILAKIDPDQPVGNVRNALLDRRRQYWMIGYLASFYSALALFALLLAVIGIYGIVSHSVGERTREFGVRIALGAGRRGLYWLVLKRSVWLSVSGAVLGLAGAGASTRVLGAMLFGTDPMDPVALGGVAMLLSAVTLLASYLPARRATKIDPLVALRAE